MSTSAPNNAGSVEVDAGRAEDVGEPWNRTDATEQNSGETAPNTDGSQAENTGGSQGGPDAPADADDSSAGLPDEAATTPMDDTAPVQAVTDSASALQDAGVDDAPSEASSLDAGSGAGSESSNDSGAPPAACGILRRIAVPDAPRTHGFGGTEIDRAFVKRVDGAFVVGPWSVEEDSGTHTDWLWVSDDGQEQQHYSIQVPGPPMGQGPELALLAMSRATSLTWVGGFAPGYAAGVIDADATSMDDYGYSGMLLESGYLVSRSSILAGTSLDGKRGLVATGFASPAFATFDPDGALVGEGLEVESDAECWRHVPTEHGNAFLQDLHLWEFGSSGELLVDYQPDSVAKDECSEVALTTDGIAFLAYETDSTWHLHRVGHDGTASDELWTARPLGPLAIAVLEDSVLVVTQTDDSLLHVRDGVVAETFPLPDTRLMRAIRAEPGKLFLDLADPELETREIVEIGCTD